MGNFSVEQKFRLRVSYKKTGPCVYLSHLELIRCLESIVRRSGLPFCVSLGYSPHMKISFGPAIGVGIECENLAFDVYLNKYIKPNEALCALSNSSVKNLEIFDCKYVDNSEKALSSNFGITNYLVVIDENILNIKVPITIEVVKKGKTKTINISDYLEGKISCENIDDKANINFSLCSSEKGSIKPEVFIKEVLKYSGCSEPKILDFKIL